MSVTFVVIIDVIVVGGGMLVSRKVRQTKFENEQRQIKQEENRAKMASLRERKEQKKKERLALEEQKKQERETLEEQRRQEMLKWQEEQKKRAAEQSRALNKLGLVEIANNDVEDEYV